MRWLSDDAIERLREDADLPDLGSSKYLVIHKLGSGGMGTVYIAQDVDLGRKVAIKVMNSAEQTGAFAARMTREARIVALLEHPSIVPIHDVGVLDDGRVFYAMKLVQGARLDEFAAGTTPLFDLLRVFQKVCEAVAFAHDRGVIHRDLKPENIMVGPFGEVLVMDWGVAKVLGSGRGNSPTTTPDNATELRAVDDTDLVSTLPLSADGSAADTRSGTVIGTPAYMAPEQARGQTELLDQRSDVYSLGAILYFLLTSQAPPEFERTADSPERSLRPRGINSKIPRAIEAVALKAMSEQREERFGSAEEIAIDVIRFLDGQPITAYRENIFEKTGRWLGKNRFIVLLILAYLIMRVIVFFSVGR